MPTVTLEFRSSDLEAIGLVPSGLFEKYEEIELMETLRLERGWRLELVRVRRRGPLKPVSELERESRRIRRLYGFESFEVVERRPRTRDYVLLVRQRNPAALERWLALAGGRIAPTAPFKLTRERAIATFVGEQRPLRRVLGRLKREGFPYRVLRASSRPPAEEPNDGRPVTDRQKAALARAWALGYYAVPRRVTLTRLSKTTGQSPPALGKMLRRAEGRLVARFLAQELESAPGEADGSAGPEDAPASERAQG
jgi:predicted DNA binding protein